MILGTDSIIVQTWFAAILNGWITIEKVPTAFGIRAAVQQLLDSLQPTA